MLFPHGAVALRAVSAEQIRVLNREHRHVDAATDVLSFPAGEHALHGHRGDIALCWPVALAQARANGNSAETEAVALIAHGMLHLAGLDHDTAKAEAVMDTRTQRLCQAAGYFIRTYGH
jgi:probable rRNA maturation factor